MAEPTIEDIDALVAPATPHFAYQLRARVRELIVELAADHPVRRYGEEKMELLDRLGHASSLAGSGPLEPRSRIGWETVPSSAPAADPLPSAPMTTRSWGVARKGGEREARRTAPVVRTSAEREASRRERRQPPAEPGRRAGVGGGQGGVVSFDGASVLITGGTRGIGKATALRFASLGARRIALGYMRGDRAAEETASELTELGVEPVLVRGNVASKRVADDVAALGALDVLVHAAATGVIRPALETNEKHWDWTLSANARALLSLTRAAAPSMPSGSAIVGISSLGSIRVLEDYSLVGASKAALEALIRYLAVELAPRGIAVNCVSAGVVDTGALEHFPRRDDMLALGKRNPVGRIVTPEDVAACVTFLCSPEAAMIRGQTLLVDGGGSLLLPM